MDDVLAFGGQVVIRTFETPRDVLALSENVIVNCTGLGAKALFGDDELMPLRGLLVLLPPQEEVAYSTSGGVNIPESQRGLFIHMMPRQDGIVLGGTSERDQWIDRGQRGGEEPHRRQPHPALRLDERAAGARPGDAASARAAMSAVAPAPSVPARSGLAREMGLLGLTATGICSMVGAGLNVIPFMIQRSVPGIGPNVLPAFLLGAVPAVLAGLAYAMLASAMPRAGGSYVYASRALSPYLGFIASFSQWFALCVAIGVVSYVITPFLRDIAVALQWSGAAALLENGVVRAGHLALLPVGRGGGEPARGEGLRAADGAVDVPDLRARRGGDRGRVLVRPRRLPAGPGGPRRRRLECTRAGARRWPWLPRPARC